jgi:peptidoglycan LD-endopeptidase LytH
MKPLNLYPLMGSPLGADNSLVLDLSTSNTFLSKEVYEKNLPFQEFLSLQLKASGKKFAIGGYLEKRVIYGRSKVFASGESTFRSILKNKL